jgi:hypothetical protein
VPKFVITTFASGTTAPEGSVTVPTIPPVAIVDCAHRPDVINATSKANPMNHSLPGDMYAIGPPARLQTKAHPLIHHSYQRVTSVPELELVNFAMAHNITKHTKKRMPLLENEESACVSDFVPYPLAEKNREAKTVGVPTS